jgi:hypothetical protein
VDVEILAPGTFKGVAVTSAMLDELVTNFARLHPLGIKPPVKLGHDWSDTEPAVGHVTALKRVGDKVVATLSDVAEIVKRAIQAKRYTRCSAEFWTKFEHSPDEKNLKSGVTGAALTGLALLGARPPSVKSLRDLEAFLADVPADGAAVFALSDDAPTLLDEAQATRRGGGGDAVPASSSAATDQKAGAAVALPPSGHPRTTDPAQEDPIMDEAMKKALLSELRAEVVSDFEAKLADERTKHADELKAAQDVAATKLAEAVAAKDAELKRVTDEVAAIRTREQAAEARLLHEQAVKFADEALRKPRIFPKQVPFATVLYEQLSDTPSIKAEAAEAMGLEKRDWSPRELFVAFAELYPTAKILREMAEGRVTSPATDPEARLVQIATEHQLNLAEPAQRQQALAILGRQPDGVVVPDYRTPTDPRRLN